MAGSEEFLHVARPAALALKRFSESLETKNAKEVVEAARVLLQHVSQVLFLPSSLMWTS